MFRHKGGRGFEPATPPPAGHREAIEAHYERHIGPDPVVWHELVSHLVHIDVYVWAPTDERPVHTLATVGMSDRPMALPQGAARAGIRDRAELLLCLPPDWPVPGAPYNEGSWADDESYFPIRALKELARLPHEYDTWLGMGHTVPNDDPPAPLTPGTELCGWLLMPPVTFPIELSDLVTPAGGVSFFGLVGLTSDELDLKLARGADALLPGFERHGVSEVLDVSRRSSLGP